MNPEEIVKLVNQIARYHQKLIGQLSSIHKIEAGFRNTLFKVNEHFIIKICTNKALEETFHVENEFYQAHQKKAYLPNLYVFDDTKKVCDFVYEIIEAIPGNTLYYYWYQMQEEQREETIQKLMKMIKDLHVMQKETMNWGRKIQQEIMEKLEDNKTLFSENDFQKVMHQIATYDEYLIDNHFATIHNDLHFDNIMFDDGNLKIIDFNDAMVAPIDFEFRLLYLCQEQPWKWADEKMDPYQKVEDYRNIWYYIKKYYPVLNEIQYLEQRMKIYRVWNDVGHLKEYPSEELVQKIVQHSVIEKEVK